MADTMRTYYKRVRARFNQEAKKWVKEHLWWDVGVLLGPAIVAFVIYRIRPDYIVLWSSLVFYAAIFLGYCAIQLLRTPWQLDVDRQVNFDLVCTERDHAQNEVVQLQSRERSGLAEEDPKVYLDPLNAEFIPRGCMPFRISNQGQRVNPAQAVSIQRITNVPSIAFDYIDRIDPANSMVIVPTVDGHHLVPHHDILPELRQAWEDAHASGELDSDEFPFTITIHYRDAKGIKFISDVSLKYSPLAEDDTRRTALSAHRMEYPIIKVTNTHIRRLS